VVVGVNRFTEESGGTLPPILSIGPEVERRQVERLAEVRASRDGRAVDKALSQVAADAASAGSNLMPALLQAARARATVGEIVGCLEEVFGRFVEDPAV
jgi:methylmalonyl-CoA mutase N-terminal domain/subunit